MSNADPSRDDGASQSIAAQQAAARRAERRPRILAAVAGVTIVVLVVVGIVVAKALSKPPAASHSPGTATGSALPAGVQSAVASVPASTLTAVGTGSVFSGALTAANGPTLTSGRKPEMLYIGAEWCPYCAAERWAMAIALSRFGTFSTLRGVHSSSADVYPSTATLTFYKSTYTSKYLVFTPVENEDVNRNLLQSPTPAQQALWNKYDPSNGYPFIDIGNRFIAGSTYSPQVLQGLSWSQIASDLSNPSSPVAKGAVGSANVFTAVICTLTGNQPASVCTSPPVSALEPRL
jgi:thiol-disulfide isomerase/thioredoxin